jgi:dTDP-4-amino-4,6-dideoxygalactose transaminase
MEGRSLVRANDFARQWRTIRDDALSAVDRVGHSGWLILGEEVAAFEQEFAAWWGAPYAVGVASGLDAIAIALRSADIGAGARVITTPLTAFATTLAILQVGARPVWCDVDRSGNLDLDQVDARLQADKTIKAVLPVHLYGHPLDPAALRRLADDYGVVIVEDCAQSLGAERDGSPTGLSGIAAGTSLYPTKNLGIMGDGGVLLTKDAELARRARRLRDYGQEHRYVHVEAGLNSRLDELHAAILRSALLPRLDAWLKRRAEIAFSYMAGLKDCGLRLISPSGGNSANHLFPVEVLDRDLEQTVKELHDRGISVGRHYPRLCSDQVAAEGAGEAVGDLEVARTIAEREISLPIHPHLDDGEVEAVIHACKVVCG